MCPDFSNEAIAAIRRMVKHLPQQYDLTLIVLKGHLLIEQQMMDIVRKRTPADEAAKINTLRFFPLTRVVRALAGPEVPDVTWQGIDLLNKIRNSLAHKLEPADTEVFAAQLVGLLRPDLDSLGWLVGGGDPTSLEMRLKAAIAVLSGLLVRLTETGLAE